MFHYVVVMSYHIASHHCCYRNADNDN